jgi:diguanylate cyclase
MGFLTAAATPAYAYGALLLFIALSLGVWLGRRQASAGSRASESDRALRVLEKLFDWTARFASDVSEYRAIVSRLAERFSDVRAEGVGQNANDQRTVTLNLLEQIVSANENVQDRLAAAETKLQQQAGEIACYVSEARTDALTGLPNRRAFDDELTRRFAAWRRHEARLSMLLVDVDHFKKFNDRHGHLAGDAVLHEVAQALHATMRQSDLVARFGGEEFAAVLPHSDIGEARQAAERVRRAIQQRVFRFEDRSLQVTVSCGAAQALRGEDSASLITRADAALYSAKKAGRNAAYWHDGVQCLPVAVDHSTGSRDASPEPAAGPAQKLRGDFGRVCDELRRRLMQVIERDGGAS